LSVCRSELDERLLENKAQQVPGMTTKITVVDFLIVSVIASTVFANYSDKMQEKKNSNRKTQIKLNISKFFLVIGYLAFMEP